MTRPRPGIGSELLPVALILVCLIGTWSLIIEMHRRAAIAPGPAPSAPPAPVPSPAPTPAAVAPSPAPMGPPTLPPRKPHPIPPPPEDPTKRALARLALAQAEQILAAQLADRRAEAIEKARQAAVADSERWKRREVLVKTQIDALAERAQRLESEADALALERDVLAHERDAAKAALAKARTRTSYAVLPHKGANGTWRRPIIIECRNGAATLQPHGPTFSLVEMSGLFGVRSAPIVAAVAKELIKAQATSTPDGAPAVPYIFFVVRPDGIRPYYEARGRLEPLGIAFGYELVEQDWEIDYPDLDNLEEWDGAPPRPGTSPPVANAVDPVGPSARPRRDGDNSVESFVWPTQPASRGADFDSLPGLVGSGSSSGPGSGPRPGRGGRTGHDPDDGSGGDAFARDGLGTDGHGVDPLGVPFADPGPGRPGGMPDSSGVAPRGIDRGGVPGGRTGLRPIGPDGLPSLEDPSGTGGGRPGAPGSPAMGGPGRGSGSPPARGGGVAPSALAANSNAATTGPGEFKWPSRNHVSQAADSGLLGLGPPTSPRFGATGSGAGMGPASESGGSEGSGGAPGDGGSASAKDSSGSSSASAGGQAAGGNGVGIPVPLPLPHSNGAGGGEMGLPGGVGTPEKRPNRLEVPFEIVVACGPDGVVIHPGGYHLSPKALKSKDGMLTKELRSVVRLRQQVDLMIRPRPSIRFLVEPGGNDTYWDARRQTLMSGLDWPITLQVG
ncbi:MAG: hypothetical protein ACM35G_12485, partial [Planctomycetaceae bacterium]